MRTTAISLALAVAVAFGYVETFTKGIDRLPERPCAGAVDRDLAARALPSARTAEERGRLEQGLHGFTFRCHVRTSDDSSLVGDAETSDADVRSWHRHFLPKSGEEGAIEVSSGDVRGLSLAPDSATVFVPCAPPRSELPAHALVVDATTIGTTRAQGDELRQIVVDFAYQLARHAYRVGECQAPRSFPDSLPRLSEGRVMGESPN
ncbi:hypothetical protein [Streptomyces roseolilacinus]|uniref:Uncharacterized protein n=1 Tax=Streptomyces roseolilacinus TaxID=66904 RepID=A0A918B4Q2_9ACTN|nr:hypothetical protein [Streptomyces roseolilacinus]GGQ25936.1 hypothetical protein GCM10010249_51060 [Streptomyces roseolilacinus]